MKKIIVILVTVALVIVLLPKFVYFMINLNIDPKNISLCKAEVRARKEVLQGIVYQKYKDRHNHNYETIRINYSDSITKSYILVLDNSGLFNYIQKGDSISKMSGELNFHVSRDGIHKDFKLIYGCKE